MDFIEDLFDFGERKHRNKGGFFQNGGHHDEDHHDDDHHGDHGHRQNQDDPFTQGPMNSTQPANQPFPTAPLISLAGVMCRKCSTHTVQGAKFCHVCGTAIDLLQICASCGSKLPANGLFCAQCGYKNG
jgi:ribosomal protein L40E